MPGLQLQVRRCPCLRQRQTREGHTINRGSLSLNQFEASTLWQNSQFRAYMGSTAFTGAAQSMQQLLISWLLVGILLLSADQVGMIQAMIGLPGIVLLLWGGASADRTDARGLLIKVYGITWLFPAVLYVCVQADYLNIWSVAIFGLLMSTAIAFSSPAQQAILNRVSGKDVQRAVTAATAIGFGVQILGLLVAGQMEVVGVGNILIIQTLSLILGGLAIRKIAPSPPAPLGSKEPMLHIIYAGLQASHANKTIFNTLVINFISSVFNGGAFVTVLPFIVKRSYDGDAIGLATIMIVFFGGATISNIIQFKIMPLAMPGLWFLIMQFTRVLILGCLWLKPEWWLLMIVLFVWGLNMGVTTTLSRTIVQESARPEFLARILSVYSLGLLGSLPIGAVILGFLIEAFGTMNALIPAMISSLLLCVYGFFFTRVWRYRSPAFDEKAGG